MMRLQTGIRSVMTMTMIATLAEGVRSNIKTYLISGISQKYSIETWAIPWAILMMPKFNKTQRRKF